MTFGYSRDDVGKFLPIYLSKGILQNDPFEVRFLLVLNFTIHVSLCKYQTGFLLLDVVFDSFLSELAYTASNLKNRFK